MSDALKEHDDKVSIGGGTIAKFKVSTKSANIIKMEISTEKSKVMANSANGIQTEIEVKEQLRTVTSYK